MKKFTELIDRYVFEMWTGILIFGIVCLIGLIFVPDRTAYLLCLCAGIITAIISAYHMWWSIDRALDKPQADAAKSMSLQFIIRYTFYIIVLALMGIKFGSYVLATFLGIMAIKAGSYMEPLTKKLSVLLYGEEILPPVIDYLYDEEKPVDVQE